MSVYLRKYELVIGSPAKTYAVAQYRDVGNLSGSMQITQERNKNLRLATEVVKTDEYVDYRTIPPGEEALVIKDLQIEAEIKYSSSGEEITSPSGTFRIYNLAESSRDFIKKDSILFIKGGYETDTTYFGINQERDEEPERGKLASIPLLFCGQVTSVSVEKRGYDLITEIACKDLGFAARNVKISKTYPRRTDSDAIIQDLLSIAAQNGIPTGFFITPKDRAAAPTVPGYNTRYTTGFNIEGGLLEELSKFCNSVGMQAYIAAGQLYVEPKGNKSRIEVVVVYPNSIKSIQKKEDTTGETTTSDQVVAGIRMVTFLNGNITVNKMLKVASGRHAGVYKITDVEHSLNLEGGEWDTIVTATKV